MHQSIIGNSGLPQQYGIGRQLMPARNLASVPTDTEGEKTTSPLIYIFPNCRAVTAGFNVVSVPAALNVPAGQSAWLSLLDFAPADQLGQEVTVFGVGSELLSTNNSDSGALVNLYGVLAAAQGAWGDKFGTKAAIVMGQNLPVAAPGSASPWSTAPCQIPTLNDTLSAQAVRYWDVWTFPQGAMRDALPFKEKLFKPYAPYAYRVGFSERVQVALVIDGTQATAAAGLSIVGLAVLRVMLGLTKNLDSFTP